MKKFLTVVVALGLAVGGATAAHGLTHKITYPEGSAVTITDGTCRAAAYSTTNEDWTAVTSKKSGYLCDFVRSRVHYDLYSWTGYSNWTTDPTFAVRWVPVGADWNHSQHGADSWH